LSIAVDEVLRYVKNTPAKLNFLAISKFFPFHTLPDSIVAIVALTNLYQAHSQGQQVTKKYRKKTTSPAALYNILGTFLHGLAHTKLLATAKTLC
jgi:hypothetical protein